MKLSLPKFPIVLVLFLLTACAYDADDNLVNGQNGEFTEIIPIESDLFRYLQEITSDDERPDKTIACINFIYPLTIFVFNDTNDLEFNNLIFNDDQFSMLLENIDETYSISMSFPITTILESGEEFIVENKEELKDAIDMCLYEELVYECNQLIESCIWKVGYSYNYENQYLGSIFQESNGFTTLNVDNELSSGSWSPLIIQNELHLNINIIDDSEVGEFFNYDWTVDYIDENSILLKNDERELILNQRCDDSFSDCKNFRFVVCETETDSGISEFILDDYTFCIFDTLELDDTLDISFYETVSDAENGINPIATDQAFFNTVPEQTLYVRINDIENDMQYFVLITLISINC